MSEEIMSSSSNNEWLQYYHQQTTLNHDDLHQAHAITNTSNSSSGHESKPIRRRSRASKKTPTTLLNANANNFRALVQRFTGCPNNSISLANQKGPVNLNFGLKNATPIAEPFQNHYEYRRESQLEVQRRENQPQQQSYFLENNYHNIMAQGHPSTYTSLNTMTSNNVFSNIPSSMDASSTMEISNGFVMEENLSVNEFSQSGYIFR